MLGLCRVQQTGPDGCLYVLDWYDQYHCYQDANADPEGVERAKGRLYRLVYEGNDPSAKKTRLASNDIGSMNDDALIKLLYSENGFERSTAQRLLVNVLTRQVSRCSAKSSWTLQKTNERGFMHLGVGMLSPDR